MSLKEELAKVIDKKDLDKIKTAYDIVGDIAIIEISEDLVALAKTVAETIFKINTNVRSVYRKDGGHGGEFRIQNYTFIAGEKNTITAHKENGISLELDIKEVYFSPRSATERKRVFLEIKEHEDILVMFSGCGPFSVGASKNSKASHITSVEMNPSGDKFAKSNAISNKAFNTTFINLDANKIIDHYYTSFIGLKSSIEKEQLEKRLEQNPKLLELHLFKKDLFENKANLIKTIKMLQEKNIEVIIHIPFIEGSNGKTYSLEEDCVSKHYDVIIEFAKTCKEFNIKGVFHPVNSSCKDEKYIPKLEHYIRKLKPYYTWLYFENTPGGIFSEPEDIIKIAKKTGFKNICVDISHLGIMKKNTDEVKNALKLLTKKFNTYFHIANSTETADACEFNKGILDMKKLLPLITSGVIEVRNKDETNPEEMLRSLEWLKCQSPTFDRIIMPLPKTSFDFLETVVNVSKKGTIVNFYCFIDDTKIPEEEQRIKDKIKEIGKEVKIIKSTKCGQQSPRCYRVCVDFEFLE